MDSRSNRKLLSSRPEVVILGQLQVLEVNKMYHITQERVL